MLRKMVCLSAALVSFAGAALGGVVWSSSGSSSGSYVATRTWSEDYSTTTESGSFGSTWSGDRGSWTYIDAGTSATGGYTGMGFLFGPIGQDGEGFFIYDLDAETSMMFLGDLLIPGTGIAEVELDMSYDWGTTLSLGEPNHPLVVVGGVPVATDVKYIWGGPRSDVEYEYWRYSGKATAAIERGVPVSFAILYTSVFSGREGMGDGPGGDYWSNFSLDAVREVPTGVPEPSNILLAATGLAALWSVRLLKRRSLMRRPAAGDVAE